MLERRRLMKYAYRATLVVLHPDCQIEIAKHTEKYHVKFLLSTISIVVIGIIAIHRTSLCCSRLFVGVSRANKVPCRSNSRQAYCRWGILRAGQAAPRASAPSGLSL